MKKSILLTSLFMLPLFSMVMTAQDKASGVPAIKIATQGAQNEGKLLSFLHSPLRAASMLILVMVTPEITLGEEQ